MLPYSITRRSSPRLIICTKVLLWGLFFLSVYNSHICFIILPYFGVAFCFYNIWSAIADFALLRIFIPNNISTDFILKLFLELLFYNILIVCWGYYRSYILSIFDSPIPFTISSHFEVLSCFTRYKMPLMILHCLEYPCSITAHHTIQTKTQDCFCQITAIPHYYYYYYYYSPSAR